MSIFCEIYKGVGRRSTFMVVSAIGVYFGRHELTRMQENLPPFTSAAGKTEQVWIEMQDGVRLFSSVALPEGEGPLSDSIDQKSVRPICDHHERNRMWSYGAIRLVPGIAGRSGPRRVGRRVEPNGERSP